VTSDSPHPPMFFVSVASKELRHFASSLFATHRRGLRSVASKRLRLHQIVQNRSISACGNALPHLRDLRDLRANDARSCWRKDLGGILRREKRRTDPEKSPLRQGRNLPDRIEAGQSTRDVRSGRASLTYARRGCGSKWLASSSYRSVARPALTVNKYYDVDIIRMSGKVLKRLGIKGFDEGVQGLKLSTL